MTLPKYAKEIPASNRVKFVCLDCKVNVYGSTSKAPWSFVPHARDHDLFATCGRCGKRDYQPQHWLK